MALIVSITKTERLLLRELDDSDAEFIFRLLNQESWKKYIGDKQIDSDEAALRYIQSGPVKMYGNYGFGLWAVDLLALNRPIGICGLIRRDTLPEIDLGFAFLDGYTGRGYAYEACFAAINYAKNLLCKQQLLAIALPDNHRSVKLLEKLGFGVKNPHFTAGNSDNELTLFQLNL